MVTQRLWPCVDHRHPFRTMSNGPLIPDAISNFDFWNFKVKVMGVVKWQDHVVSPISNWFTNFALPINETNNSWNKAISKFDLEKYKVKVRGEDKGQGQIVHLVSYRCISFSFHANRTNHSWHIANIMFVPDRNTSEIQNKICQK